MDVHFAVPVRALQCGYLRSFLRVHGLVGVELAHGLGDRLHSAYAPELTSTNVGKDADDAPSALEEESECHSIKLEKSFGETVYRQQPPAESPILEMASEVINNFGLKYTSKPKLDG